MTLEHQGGAMSAQEVEEFSVHPLKDIVIQMRKWDEGAKDPTKYATIEDTQAGLQYIEQLLDTQIE